MEWVSAVPLALVRKSARGSFLTTNDISSLQTLGVPPVATNKATIRIEIGAA